MRIFLVLCISSVCGTTRVSAADWPQPGAELHPSITVFERNLEPVVLRQLIADAGKPVNVVFVFGGGGFGHARTKNRGGLWCGDSFEDLRILRSLKSDFGDQIGIIPIAVPPAHHTHVLGMQPGVFLKPDWKDSTFVNAAEAFIESTEAAADAGTIPVAPYFDLEFNLMASADVLNARTKSQEWHGSFRAAGEKQQYGVPSIWLIDRHGVLVQAPFRGNVYHDHGEGISIQYTLSDVKAAINAALDDG